MNNPWEDNEPLMPRNNVYYGKQIWQKMFRGDHHLVSFQIRAKLQKGPYTCDCYLIVDENLSSPYDQFRVYIPETNPAGSIRYWKPLTEIVAGLTDGNEYIFTIYTRHHQQHLNVSLLALNYDIEKREIHEAWRYDQFYPGYPIYDTPQWNEWGEPWPTDEQIAKNNETQKNHPYWQWEKKGDRLVRKYPEAYAEYLKSGPVYK